MALRESMAGFSGYSYQERNTFMYLTKNILSIELRYAANFVNV